MKNEDLMYDIDFKNSTKFQIYLSICKKEKKNLIISIILLIIKHSPAMVLPIIIGQVINAVIAGGPNALNSILFSSGIILFLFLQNIITQTYFIKYLSKANRSIEKALRYSLIKRMQELSIAFHNNFESGKLQSKVLRDVESIEILNRQMMNNVATGIITILFSMIATLMHSYFVATFYLVTIPLSTVLIRIFQGKMAARNKEYRNEIEIMSARVNEMVQMIPIARAHGVEDSEIDYMAKHLDKVKEKGIKLDVLNAFFGASTWVTYQIFQFVCL